MHILEGGRDRMIEIGERLAVTIVVSVFLYGWWNFLMVWRFGND